MAGMMHSLRLYAKPGTWRLFMQRKADPAFRSFGSKVLQRDNFTCQFCGFQARDYQEVVNLDNDYGNNKLSNLVTSCIFCAQCFFLESVGTGDFGGGSLIYLPEMTQTEINSLCHVLFCAIANDTGYKESAQAIYRSLKFRSQMVEKKFSEGAEQPSVFGQLLIDANMNDVEGGDLLQDMRLLPARGRFKTQIEHWAASALDTMGGGTEQT